MKRNSISLPILAFLACSLSAGWVLAQETGEQDAEATPPPVATIEPIAPYDPKLLRLSEVLGSIHYLRALCGANEGSKWRDMMAQIVSLEEPGPKRRASLVARFNRGYRAFDGTYSACTASALLAAERYMKEGVELTSQITARYGR